MRCNQIGVEVSREEFVSFLNSVQPGQFFSVKGYVNSNGEKSDQILRFGIKYGNIKARDVRFLQNVLAQDSCSPDHLRVNHGVWIEAERLSSICLSAENIAALPQAERAVLVDMTVQYQTKVGDAMITVSQQGTVNPMDTEVFSNRKSKTRIAATVSYRIPCNHPLVVAAIGAADLQGTLLQGLLAPREASTEYDKEGQSAYSKADEPNRWYIRDVLAVSKTVRVVGDYPFSATLPINGIKSAIQSSWLLTGKYRQFVLTDGQFESITIDGQAILCDGVDEQFYFALPEAVKEAVAAETLG